jgi:hypothetical protein
MIINYLNILNSKLLLKTISTSESIWLEDEIDKANIFFLYKILIQVIEF